MPIGGEMGGCFLRKMSRCISTSPEVFETPIMYVWSFSYRDTSRIWEPVLSENGHSHERTGREPLVWGLIKGDFNASNACMSRRVVVYSIYLAQHFASVCGGCVVHRSLPLKCMQIATCLVPFREITRLREPQSVQRQGTSCFLS